MGSSLVASNAAGDQSETTQFLTVRGIGLLLLYCAISGPAGVLTEKILKRNRRASLHLQNLPLYVFGVGVNGLLWWMERGQDMHSLVDLTRGFNRWVWVVVVSQAANGLLLSAVMKHTSSIVKLFVVAAATLLGCVLATLVFHLPLPPFFVIATLLVLTALRLYF